MANTLFDALFAKHADNTGLFIDDPIDNQSVTYKAFIEQTGRLANAITAAGLKPGDRLVAQVGKSVNALALYGACVRAGVVYLPLNTAYTDAEVDYFVSDCSASFLVCDPNDADRLNAVADKASAMLMTQSRDGNRGTLPDAAQAESTEFDTVNRSVDDLCALLYTSGTTGRSKGAMLTHGNLLSNTFALTELWEFTKDDILLHALPIFHTHGLFVATNIALLSSARLIFEPKFDLDRIIERLPHATCMMGVPTFYTRLLADVRLDKSLVGNMRLFVSGSAPLLAETHRQFESVTGHTILERYGMTETNMNTSNPYKGDRIAGTVGLPLNGIDLKITDPNTGTTLPNGEIGVIEVRGPNVFKGYWKMPEKTAEELRADGFFITGDLGTIDEHGYVSIVGRNKDLIITGGYNVYPKEIEQVLDDQPGVLESAVIGVPHADFGETVVGILVADGPTMDLEHIKTSVEQSLARFKHPNQLLVVEELPRNTMGKVLKNVLRDRYADLFSDKDS